MLLGLRDFVKFYCTELTKKIFLFESTFTERYYSLAFYASDQGKQIWVHRISILRNFIVWPNKIKKYKICTNTKCCIFKHSLTYRTLLWYLKRKLKENSNSMTASPINREDLNFWAPSELQACLQKYHYW